MSFKSGFVTVVGTPNAGKSSLINKLVAEEVSIVSAKPQTTRKRTLGIAGEKNKYQIVFVDTPGFIEASTGLNRFLKNELEESFKDVNLIVAIIAPWEFEKDQKPWSVLATEKLSTPVIYVATQIDKRKPMLEKWKEWTDKGLLSTSSHTGHGLDLLKSEILSLLPEGPAYYDFDIYTNQTMRELASEVIRKHCFENLHQEIPYGLAVLVREFEEGPVYKIQADIILSREKHKGMVIGQKGQMLKKIGTESRLELQKNLGLPVVLKLHVVVKEHWIKNKTWMEELGYVRQ